MHTLPKWQLLLLLLLLPALLLSLVGCGGREDVFALYADIARRQALPAGLVYRSDAQPWQPACLTPALAEALFGNDAGHRLLATAQAYVIHLGLDARAPRELMLLACPTREGRELLAGMCRQRLEQLRRAWPDADHLRTATVTVEGHVVLYRVGL